MPATGPCGQTEADKYERTADSIKATEDPKGFRRSALMTASQERRRKAEEMQRLYAPHEAKVQTILGKQQPQQEDPRAVKRICIGRPDDLDSAANQPIGQMACPLSHLSRFRCQSLRDEGCFPSSILFGCVLSFFR